MLKPCCVRFIYKRTSFNKFFQERHVSYVQGQEPEPKIREYFYYIDHQGMVSIVNLEIIFGHHK